MQVHAHLPHGCDERNMMLKPKPDDRSRPGLTQQQEPVGSSTDARVIKQQWMSSQQRMAQVDPPLRSCPRSTLLILLTGSAQIAVAGAAP